MVAFIVIIIAIVCCLVSFQLGAMMAGTKIVKDAMKKAINSKEVKESFGSSKFQEKLKQHMAENIDNGN